MAVFSGNDKTAVNGGNREHLVIQVPPLTAWSKQFVAVRTWRNGLPLFIMVGTDNTNVNITCTGTSTELGLTVNAGDIYQKFLSLDEYCLIETTHPVFVVQANGNADPSFLHLTPIDQYSMEYSFMSPTMSRSFTYYFIYVIEELAISDLLLDSTTLKKNQLSYQQIPGTTLIGGYFTVSSGSHYVNHATEMFYGVLLGLASSESFAVSLERKWKVSNKLVMNTKWSFVIKKVVIFGNFYGSLQLFCMTQYAIKDRIVNHRSVVLLSYESSDLNAKWYEITK